MRHVYCPPTAFFGGALVHYGPRVSAPSVTECWWIVPGTWSEE